jgi:hypothetical protein
MSAISVERLEQDERSLNALDQGPPEKLANELNLAEQLP